MGQTLKNLEYYRRLPYTLHREPRRDTDGSSYWTAEYLELRGCKTDGLTEAEAVANLQELFDEYVSARLESDMDIPEPQSIPITVQKIWILVQEESVSSMTPDTELTKGTRANIPTMAAIAPAIAV